MNAPKKRSPFVIVRRLIVLVRPMLPVMLPVHCRGEAGFSVVLSEDVRMGISGGTWGAARNFCIFLTKEGALLM